MKNSIPLFYHPIRKILLDDDNTFTQSVLLKMHGKYFSGINSITEGLKFLSEEYKPKISKHHLISLAPTLFDPLRTYTLNTKFEKNDKNIFENFRDDISILFIDYHMPDMNGLDFLKKIKESPIKKVLITSEHDYTIAIDAFNNGIIDGYLRKDAPDFLIKLQHITSELEWAYFTDLCKIISDLPEFDYLKNSDFIKFFIDFITNKNITDFYLTDKQGAFCTYNAAGVKEYFIIRNTTQLQQLSDFAADDGASEKTINDLSKAKAVPFFNFKEHWEIPANEWESYLYSANELPGDPDFLWATVKPDLSSFSNDGN